MANFANLFSFRWEPPMSTMNISLTPQLEKLVQDRVRSGRYTSASEVMREALRLLDSHDRAMESQFAQLRAGVDAGMRQLENGKSMPFDLAAVARVRRRGREKLAESKGTGR